MRQILFLLFAAVLISLPAAVLAADDVASTEHNLSTLSTQDIKTTDGTNQICVFCHTPHNGVKNSAPLWNRKLPTGPYTMYSSPTIDMTIASSPQGVSLACLSCHDGTIGFDELYTDGTGPETYSATAATRNWTFQGANGNKMPAGPTLLGTDLSNTHPISVTYDITKDTAFNAASNGKIGTLPLYGTGKDQVECASCHNPHSQQYMPFLRMDNAASALCKTCHIK